MSNMNLMIIDGRKIAIENERNLLEMVRKANIDIPTFCYHSELSIYGACRLCLVEVEGRGLVAACSEPPVPGMRIRTLTDEIREIRRTNLELLLANHDQQCPTCTRSDNCKLRALASKMGIDKVSYRATKARRPLDTESHSLVRDPNKCVLCGDCVRFCSEVQGIGALEFINRGEGVVVSPAFGKSISKVDCVNCGQCAAVCPTGAITPKSEANDVWKVLQNEQKTVIAQVAPAVRVALGEMFGISDSSGLMGKITTALRMLGFDKVYDTSFAADLTVIEEANEFLARYKKGEKLPIFTSCCPAWVKFAEQSLPEILPNLSSCRSPQQMFGSIAKEQLPEQLGVKREDLVVVSIMPCTAKKFEARRPEFTSQGNPEVDYVLTTQELGRMIKEAGIRFENLKPGSMDLPMGFATGAGVIFGQSGGVSEAVVRYAGRALTGKSLDQAELDDFRNDENIRQYHLTLGDVNLRLAVVYGLKAAKETVQRILRGEMQPDIVEVMACPDGCIGGAGQPIVEDHVVRKQRTCGIENADLEMVLHSAEENPYIDKLYAELLEEPNSHKAHELLHTHYHSRKRIESDEISIIPGTSKERFPVRVCVGTSCYVRGSQTILAGLLHEIENQGLTDSIDLRATFCSEKCNLGPTVTIGEQTIHHATYETACKMMLTEAAKYLVKD